MKLSFCGSSGGKNFFLCFRNLEHLKEIKIRTTCLEISNGQLVKKIQNPKIKNLKSQILKLQIPKPQILKPQIPKPQIPKLQIQNHESHILKPKSQILNPESQTSNFKSRITN